MEDKQGVVGGGLGDIVAVAFASVGITKQLAGRAAAAVGFKSCGCNERQKLLNDLGHNFLGMSRGSTAENGPK